MEAMRMKLFAVLAVVMMMAISAVKGVAAAEAPAPSPTSDSAVLVPAAVASVSPSWGYRIQQICYNLASPTKFLLRR
ncbi:hypothetical protein RJ640_013196 [Escallonia rubra]|uniref:Uncharacterized protein n=1 Tax=Escallonia rubra TaxID=112253 RepID=A0AA88QYH5_9ASTE|nr:hypothetical protein RJ640_013196 [Escallonia rubra]